MPIEKRSLRQTLLTKFHFEEVPGSKHEAVALFIDDKKVATTRSNKSNPSVLMNLNGARSYGRSAKLAFRCRPVYPRRKTIDYCLHYQRPLATMVVVQL